MLAVIREVGSQVHEIILAKPTPEYMKSYFPALTFKYMFSFLLCHAMVGHEAAGLPRLGLALNVAKEGLVTDGVERRGRMNEDRDHNSCSPALDGLTEPEDRTKASRPCS